MKNSKYFFSFNFPSNFHLSNLHAIRKYVEYLSNEILDIIVVRGIVIIVNYWKNFSFSFLKKKRQNVSKCTLIKKFGEKDTQEHNIVLIPSRSTQKEF